EPLRQLVEGRITHCFLSRKTGRNGYGEWSTKELADVLQKCCREAMREKLEQLQHEQPTVESLGQKAHTMPLQLVELAMQKFKTKLTSRLTSSWKSVEMQWNRPKKPLHV